MIPDGSPENHAEGTVLPGLGRSRPVVFDERISVTCSDAKGVAIVESASCLSG